MAIGAVKLQLVTAKMPVTAEVASSSLVVPAILSKRVERISLLPTRVQKGAILHPFCTPFRQLEALSGAPVHDMEGLTLVQRSPVLMKIRERVRLPVQRASLVRSPACTRPRLNVMKNGAAILASL